MQGLKCVLFLAIASASTADDDRCAGWAEAGYCNDDQYAEYMLTECASFCGSTGDAGAVEREEDAGEEAKTDEDCVAWAAAGYCTDPSYAAYMKENCATHCPGGGDGAAEPAAEAATGEDTGTGAVPAHPAEKAAAVGPKDNPQCGEWAGMGYCTLGSFTGYMQENCKLTCAERAARGDVDELLQVDNAQCAQYAASGGCRTHQQYMQAHCASSCDDTESRHEAESIPPPAGILVYLFVFSFGVAVFYIVKMTLAWDYKMRRTTQLQSHEVGEGSAKMRSTKKGGKTKKA